MRKNAIVVLIPKYGLEGTVFFEEKDKPKPRLIYDDEVHKVFLMFLFGVFFLEGAHFLFDSLQMVPIKCKITYCTLQNFMPATLNVLLIISHFRVSPHIQMLSLISFFYTM